MLTFNQTNAILRFEFLYSLLYEKEIDKDSG